MYTEFNMAEDSGKGEIRPLSLVQKMNFWIHSKNYSLEQIEKLQNAGFILEPDASTGKLHVTGRIIVGSHDKDNLDISE